MKLNKAELQRALEIVKPGLASKEMIEQSTSFAFIAGRVVTYNDEISLSHPVSGLEIEGVIQAEELYQLLNKIKKDEIEIIIQDNEIILQIGRSKAGLTLKQEITLPLEEIGEQKAWKKLPQDFLHFMEFAMTSCGKDMSRPVLTCVHVTKEGFVESSDSLRITRCEIGEKMPFGPFLIPVSSVRTLVKLKPTKIAEGEGWVHFQTEEGSIMSCRIFEDKFPDISPFLLVEGIAIHLPKTTEDVLDRAKVFSKRDHFLDEEVEITLADNRLKIGSKSESGWFEEEINFVYTDDPITFSISPYLLKDILKETSRCVLGEDRLKFEGSGWTYISILRETIK